MCGCEIARLRNLKTRTTMEMCDSAVAQFRNFAIAQFRNRAIPNMISAQTARRAVWHPLWELPRRSELILSLAKRELLARYKGSVLGIVWAVLTPIVIIAIFTFIFAGMIGARFGTSTSRWD